jgi:peptide chain release factor subunit 1
LYSKVPPNGIVIYTGTVVTDAGKKKAIAIDFKPFESLLASLCLLDNKFNIEALGALLEYEENYIRENDKNIAI